MPTDVVPRESAASVSQGRIVPKGVTTAPPERDYYAISNLKPEPKGPPPRLAGKAPTLSDALQVALEEARKGDMPTSVSLKPEPTATEAATLRQSGTFPKKQPGPATGKGKLGQPGGYSSGRPSTTQEQFDERIGTPQESAVTAAAPTEREAAGYAGAAAEERRPLTFFKDDPEMDALMNALHGPEDLPHVPSGHGTYQESQWPPASTGPGMAETIDPTSLTRQDWLELRSYMGADELARRTGVPADVIRSDMAPGPSRLPIGDEARIMQLAPWLRR